MRPVRPTLGRALAVLGVALFLASGVEAKKPRPLASDFVRDWGRHPAIEERDTAAQIVGLGDVHGGFERLVALLLKAGLVKADPRSPVKYSWAGGERVLVCTGDLIDKGEQSIAVLDLFMAMEGQAAAAGGALIVTLGNHEAEFLARPTRGKATPFASELLARHIDPQELRTTRSPYGVWIMNRPLAARVNGWFFAHGGDSAGRTIAEWAQIYRDAVDKAAWGSESLVGPRDSILVDQKWWRDPARVDSNLKALGVDHIVFGHDPGAALPNKVTTAIIRPRAAGKAFPIDVGMSPAVDLSRGALLLIERHGPLEIATAFTAEGSRDEIWRGPFRSR
jgi:hypothetical protein